MVINKHLCGECREVVTKKQHSLLCNGTCGLWHHKICTGLTKEQYKMYGMQNATKKWKCEQCKQKNEVALLSGSDYDSAEESVEANQSNLIKHKRGKSIKTCSTTLIDIDAILAKKDPSLRELLLVMTKKFDSIEVSMNYHSDLTDQMHKTLQDIKSENKKLKQENENMKMMIKNLQKDVLNLQLKNSNHDEVEVRNKNLVIFGTSGGENAKNEVGKILKRLEVPWQSGDFTVKDIPSKLPTKPVLVSFTSKEMRNDVLEKRKLKKVIDTTECDIPGSKKKIYINEDIPRETRVLFNMARKLKENGYKFVWIKQGQIYCCKSENERAIRIVNANQIEDLLKN